MKALFYIIGLVSIIAACTGVDCSEYGRVLCTYYVVNVDGTQDTLPNQFSVEVTTNIEGYDTTLINHQEKTTDFELPMSYTLATDTLVFSLVNTSVTPHDSIADKVYITKSNTPYYEGYDCAPRYFHEISKVWSTHNFIDTLLINNSSVKNNAAEYNILLIRYKD